MNYLVIICSTIAGMAGTAAAALGGDMGLAVIISLLSITSIFQAYNLENTR